MAVGRDTLVGLLVEKSVEMVVGILGVLKAGAAYVPIDPQYPQDRIEYILQDSGVVLLLTHADTAGIPLPGFAAPTLALDDPSFLARTGTTGMTEADPDAPAPVAAAAAANDLCYVIYTSRTTGKPKGVEIEHCSVANLVAASVEAWRLGPGDRCLQFFKQCFDGAVHEYLPCLCSGAALVLPNMAKTAAAGGGMFAVAEAVELHGVTHLTLTPSAAATLDPARCPSLRCISCGGEALTPALVRRWVHGSRSLRSGSGSGSGSDSALTFFNWYGPTEATVASHMKVVAEGTSGWVADKITIGAPLNSHITQHVVDPATLAPVRPGECGELLLGGVGVARGYHNRPELTAEKFVDAARVKVVSPESSTRTRTPATLNSAHEKLYRTGDLVRVVCTGPAAGEVEFVGRIGEDTQVKLRGFRVELGEVEANLLACGAEVAEVVSATATAKAEAEPKATEEGAVEEAEMETEEKEALQEVACVATPEGHLLAFCAPEIRPAAAARVLTAMKTAVPHYMVPHCIVPMPALPRTANDKTDRAALRAAAAAIDVATLRRAQQRAL